MINPFPTEDHDLDAAIAKAHSELSTFSADSKEYAAAVDQLSKLYKLRNDSLQHFAESDAAAAKQELETTKLQLERDAIMDAKELAEKPFLMRVSPDTALTVVANLAIGLAVIKYEQTGVIRTAVRDFMKKI